jgi:hypothetical protein
LYAQKREGNVVKVQGHVHELLTKQAAEKEAAKGELRVPIGSVYNIDPANIDCWVGCVNTELTVDTAYLLIKWTDDKARARGDSILIWGYLWNPQPYSNKYSIDMIRAVANFDCRFSTLLQNTSGGDFAVGGFGYNFAGETRVPLIFDYAGAQGLAARDTIHFHYTGTPNCASPYNQFVVPTSPYGPAQLAEQAILLAGETGIIKHPLDAAYGYPAYDHDYWKLRTSSPDFYWLAGWYHNYWAFYIREGLSGGFEYADYGVATQPLNNNSVNYFIFAVADFDIPVNQDGSYSNPACCSTACTGCNLN